MKPYRALEKTRIAGGLAKDSRAAAMAPRGVERRNTGRGHVCAHAGLADDLERLRVEGEPHGTAAFIVR